MHERSSEKTMYRRYLQAVKEWRGINLRRLSGGHRGATLVAMSEEGAIVGLGNVFPDEPGDGHAAEIAVIIEDAYQGRGLGTRMIRHMLGLAEDLGFEEVVATVLEENAGMLTFSKQRNSDGPERERGTLTMRARLPVAAPARRTAWRDGRCTS
jgi:RimJ/RimL family protein N-acetyltransferase